MTESSKFTDEALFIPGPSFHVELPPIDARHLCYFSRRLLFFRCTSDAQRDIQLAAFKTGMKALLQRCPVLGGIIAPLPPGEATEDKKDWRTILPGKGIELVVRDLRGKMPTLSELEAHHFPPSQLPWNLLMPVPKDLTNDHPHDACKIQFSAIEGGTILTLAMSHTVSDGTGTDIWTQILMEETRRASIQPPQTEIVGPPAAAEIVGTDRSVLCNMESDKEFKIDEHPAYMFKSAEAAPLAPGRSIFGASSLQIPAFIRISAAGLAQLKSDATTPGAPPISTHDALVALMWRTIILIRMRRAPPGEALPPTTTTNLFMPSSARRHLPELPTNYVGNAVYQVVAALDLGTLLSPAGLQRAASEVRRAVTFITPALVKSYLAFIRDPVASKDIDYQFMNGTASTTGFAMGTNLGSGHVYGGDWGEAFGPLVCFRLVGEATNFVLPRRPDGIVEVMFAVTQEEEAVLKGEEGFGKYLAL
ncbi:hypothetical protein R3P38DRAFT_2921634 [Favolaschia claudopus]|uniref:Trichothecene 3-O-acetyltransferase-like N-terminal domain-containing protein n=1 Tax=Favolaschia claudopus TaxID=2862362 RepID=A0AAW0C6C5_9AGAR